MLNLVHVEPAEVHDAAPFEIDNDRKAEWALQRIKEIYAERDRLVELCEAMIRDYTEKIEAYDKKADSDAAYLKSLLSVYFLTVPHKVTKTQETYKLASGTLKLKNPGPTYNRNDEMLMNAFPEFVKTRRELDWKGLKGSIDAVMMDGTLRAVCRDTGEIIPEEALTVVERPLEFTVEVN